MPEYNRTNPAATQAIRYAEQAPSRRAYEQSEFEQRRLREEKARIDAAMRKPLQGSAMANVTPNTIAPSVPQTQPVPAGPSMQPPATAPARQPSVVDQQIQGLAQVPGGGAQASQMYTNQQASRQKQEDQVWELLKKGTLENQPDLIRQAKLQAQQLGLDIPTSFFDNPEVRSEMVRVIGAAKDAGMNEKQIGTVVQTYLQNNPRLSQLIQQDYQSGRGMPEALQAGEKLAISQEKEKSARTQGGATMNMVNRISKEFGIPWPDAYELYRTSPSDPQKLIVKLYSKALQDRAKNLSEPGDPEYESDEQIQARVTKAVKDIYSQRVPNVSGRHKENQNDPAGIMGSPGGQTLNGKGALSVP